MPAVERALADSSDAELRASVAHLTGAGIGGTSGRLEAGGTPVFVKLVPLTAVELRPEHRYSTANLFGLPPQFHYGIGSPGFGAWRELAAHRLVDGWVRSGATEAFPLLYHWRVLDGFEAGLPPELADVERTVAYWDGSPAVRGRITALGRATARLALFLEWFPSTLEQEFGDPEEVERQLLAGVEFMNTRGLLHFDAHFGNVLTDGRRLAFTDFGMATHDGFELSPSEREFVAERAAYDRDCVGYRLVQHLEGRSGGRPRGIVGSAAAVLLRHAERARVTGEFYRRVQQESRTVRYPVSPR
ncbi:protein kinase family protein [Kitasatospora sp. NPDC048365]|uniref:protein kinase family protein n=1 Tax=Kitasatospora sp. NPDC048365 TaxID=3364050 RepID=UPI00371CCA27